MEKDLEIFQKLSKPFPKQAYKEVRFGPRGFTTIDAYYVIGRLTEVFGLCGLGWGVFEPRFLREEGSTCISCEAIFWYKVGEERGELTAVGDAQIIKGNIAEAQKKSLTNFISKAASYLGVGLSVYQGRGLDDPYLDREAMGGQSQPEFVYDVTELSKGEKWDPAFEYIAKAGADLQEVDGVVKVIAAEPLGKLKKYQVQ